MTYPNVLLADNRDISKNAYAQAQHLRRAIADAVERRDAYIAQHGLDPSFCLPSGNWTPRENYFLRAYRHVRDGGYEVLNRLRFFVRAFSGYNLLRLTSAFSQTPVTEIPADHDQWLKANRAEPDEWVALWIKFSEKVPRGLRFSPPATLGEIGWRVDGVVVNHDTYVYQERINILYEAGVLDWLQRLGRAPRILEVGGGYGALAFALRRIFPSASYTICDLPESLMFAGLYLTLCEQDDTRLFDLEGDATSDASAEGVTLLPNYMLHRLLERGASFDLVVNTLSMSEMTEAQVEAYAEAIGRLIGQAGVFFEQNQNNKALGLIDCKEYIRRHIPWSCRLKPRLAAMTEGRANLWANVKPAFVRHVGDQGTRLDDLDEYVDKQMSRIEALEATLEERTTRLLAVERALDEKSRRLAALETTMQERNNGLGAVERALEERSERLTALEATMQERTHRLTALETTMQERPQRLTALQTTMQEGTQRLSSLEAALEDRDRKLQALEERTRSSLLRLLKKLRQFFGRS